MSMRALTALLLAALSIDAIQGSVAAAEKRVALVIGNAAYSHITQLNKPLNDAESVAKGLKGIGYEVILSTNAANAELGKLAKDFDAALKGADVGLFYYSGHGFQTNRADQQHPVNHVVPVDFNAATVGERLDTLALDVIVDMLKREARVGLIFMDACRNDPQLSAASERLAAGESKTVLLSRGFSPVNVSDSPSVPSKRSLGKGPTGLLIAYATDPGNVALEGGKGNLSPFTSALVKHMIAPGLSIAEVMGRVSAEVALETQGQQTPWNVSSLTAGTYQFIPRAFDVSGARGPTAAESPSRAKSPQKAPGGTVRRSNLPPNIGAGVGAGL